MLGNKKDVHFFHKHETNKSLESPSLIKPQTFQFSYREHEGEVGLN